jgi:hypothetical protein
MANENQNTGPNQQSANKSIIDAKTALRELIDDQGDYNNLLKSSLRDLDNMQKSYTRIAAKIDSLNKGTINVRQVERELYNLNQKNYIAKQKALDLEEGLSEESKVLVKEREKLNSLLGKAFTQSQKDLINRKLEENSARMQSNIELQHLEYAKVASKIADEEVQKGKAQLELEKKVSKQLGISGNLVKIFAEKLGVGEEVYEKMSDTSRKLVKEQGDQVSTIGKWKVAASGVAAATKQMLANITDPAVIVAGVVAAYKGAEKGLTSLGGGAAKAGNAVKGLSEDSANIFGGMASSVSGMVKNIPFVGGLLGGLVEGAGALFDFMVGVDDKIIKAGRQLNLNTGQAKALNRAFQDISFNSGNVFVTSKKLLQSQVDIADQLGVTNIMSAKMLETNIMLKDIAGLEADTRASLAESAIITGKNQDDIAKSVFAQVKGLQQATGISLDYKKTLSEASKLGGYLGLQFAKFPAQLSKSLVTVKAMGLELKQLDSMADSFLDFESSISKEFEAQLLTGKDINLAKAREAFLNNDLATAAGEITRQVGTAKDFLKLNRIQAESLASAFGMSRDQLGDMLKKQEVLAKIGAKDTDNAQKQLQLGLDRYKNQKELSAAIGEEAYQNLVNASTQEKMAGLIDKIKQSIVDFVERSGILNKVQAFMDYLTEPKNVQAIISSVKNFMANAVEFIGEAAYQIVNAIDYIAFGAIDNSFIDSLRSGSKEFANNIRSVGGSGGANFGSPAGETTNNASKNQSGGSSSSASEAGKMAVVAAAPEPKYYVLQVDAITGQKIERQVTKEYFEAQSGQFKNQ